VLRFTLLSRAWHLALNNALLTSLRWSDGEMVPSSTSAQDTENPTQYVTLKWREIAFFDAAMSVAVL
jgi:hypothetical protein